MNNTKIGIIGCGTIGSTLAEKIAQNWELHARVAYVADIDNDKAVALMGKLHLSGVEVVSISDLIRYSDLVIEAASAEISGSIVLECLRNNTDVMVMSVGGVIDYYDKICSKLCIADSNIYLPSGAVCGIDGVVAAKCGGIESVSLITRKPPEGLVGAPYFAENNIDITSIDKETVVFEGTAREAIKYFPKNINVAAVLSLAGVGVDKTCVRIITSPGYTSNSHEIEVVGAFGKITTRCDNVPSPTNPKTSYLAILAAEATLKKILTPFKIGT